MEITENNLTAQALSPEPMGENKFPPKNNKIFLISTIIFLLAIILILFLYFWKTLKQESGGEILSPNPTAESTPSAKRIPSGLATDSTFLKLEEDLNALEKDFMTVDLSEPKLSQPILEKNVSFEK